MIYQSQLEQSVWDLIVGAVQELGYAIVRIKLDGTGVDKTLEVLLEHGSGVPVDINDCQKASKIISQILDEDDPIEGFYNLQVSSTGVDRPLTRVEDFEKYIGWRVEVKTNKEVLGSRQHSGVLKSLVGDIIELLDISDLKKKISLTDISEAYLDYFGSNNNDRRAR